MLISYFILSSGFICFAVARDIPDYIHVCRRSDPRVSRCIRESVEFLRPRLKKGIPSIGVPALEPLHIDVITIFNGDPPSNLKAFLRDVNIHGASDFQIGKIKVDVQRHTYRVGVKFPKLNLVGVYDVDATILNLPIKGRGTFSADLVDVDGQGILKAEIIETNGIRQLNFTSFNLAIKISDYHLHLDNLFDGDEVLSRAITDLLEENKKELLMNALPFVERKASEILLEAANKITKNLDYDEVFPK